MTKEEIQIEIDKLNRKIAKVRSQINTQKRAIAADENKLAKLKSSLDKTASNYQALDKINNSMEGLSELRCVSTWLSHQKAQNDAQKRKVSGHMDEAYREQKKAVKIAREDLEKLRSQETNYNNKLEILKQQLKHMP